MGYPSTSAPTFRNVVCEWIARDGEILALFRFHASAGSKEFRLFSSIGEYDTAVNALPLRTSVIVIGGRQLPLREQVDRAFIASAIRLLPDGTEWLSICLTPTVMGRASWFHFADGNTHSQLSEELNEQMGASVAVGPYPFWLEDGPSVVSAMVPGPGSSGLTGIY